MFELDSATVALWREPRQAQAALKVWLERALHGTSAIVAEGGWGTLNAPQEVTLRHVNSGCVCCAGQVVLRVQLIQLLRELRPKHLLLLLSPSTHVERLHQQLQDGSLGFRAIEVLAQADNGS